MQQDLANIEQAIAAGTPVTKLPVTPPSGNTWPARC